MKTIEVSTVPPDAKELPLVCLSTGRDVEEYHRIKLSFVPAWTRWLLAAGVAPGVIAMAWTRKAYALELPLSYWRHRSAMPVGLGLMLAWGALGTWLAWPSLQAEDFATGIPTLLVSLLCGSLFAYAVGNWRLPRITAIHEGGATLVVPHPDAQFALAVRASATAQQVALEATCAQHRHDPADRVCDRCGDFMCHRCVEAGARHGHRVLCSQCLGALTKRAQDDKLGELWTNPHADAAIAATLVGFVGCWPGPLVALVAVVLAINHSYKHKRGWPQTALVTLFAGSSGCLTMLNL